MSAGRSPEAPAQLQCRQCLIFQYVLVFFFFFFSVSLSLVLCLFFPLSPELLLSDDAEKSAQALQDRARDPAQPDFQLTIR